GLRRLSHPDRQMLPRPDQLDLEIRTIGRQDECRQPSGRPAPDDDHRVNRLHNLILTFAVPITGLAKAYRRGHTIGSAIRQWTPDRRRAGGRSITAGGQANAPIGAEPLGARLGRYLSPRRCVPLRRPIDRDTDRGPRSSRPVLSPIDSL